MSAFQKLAVDVQSALEDFTTVTEWPVQWGDMDAFGHVNNVVYIRWFESARIDLISNYKSEASMQQGGIGPILASVKCDYKLQLHFPDTVFIGSKVAKVGRTSFDIEHAVFSLQHQRLAATGISVCVLFNYDTNRPTRIPPELLRQIET